MTNNKPNSTVPALASVAVPPRAKESTTALPERQLELLSMLAYKRPHGSVTEASFIAKYILATGAVADSYGNLWLTVPCQDGAAPTILWSSHTDTVHRDSGYQKVFYGDGQAFTEVSNCLGADCTTGVWIMLQMIRANVPGLYVFHRAEEIGGLGSMHAIKHERKRLAGITHAIAFDRRGYSDVITHQGARTCSDAFATDLAARLNSANEYFAYATDDSGVFTDTANYTDDIAECTNLSVGYFKQHTGLEYQDVGFACDLADAMCSVDWSGLTVSRKAGEYDPEGYGYSRFAAWSNYTPKKATGGNTFYSRTAPRDLEDYVYNNPGLVADFLDDMGFEVSDLQAFKLGFQSLKEHHAAPDVVANLPLAGEAMDDIGDMEEHLDPQWERWAAEVSGDTTH
jgi:hypothetical protein